MWAHWRQIEKDAKDKASPDAADKSLSPTPAAPLPKNQHGADGLVVPIYGALTDRFEAREDAPAKPTATLLGMMQPPVAFDRDSAAADRFAPLATDPTVDLDPDRVPMTPTLAASTAGADAGSAEERALAASSGPMTTFPVSAAQRADEKARAAHYGVPAGPDSLPADDAAGAEVASVDQGAPKATPGKGRITDASEGTKLDPLLDKSLRSELAQDRADVHGRTGHGSSARVSKAASPPIKPRRRTSAAPPAAAPAP